MKVRIKLNPNLTFNFIEIFKVADDQSTITPTKEDDEKAPKSTESPIDTPQVTETDASTLPSPEYTDVEAEVKGKYDLTIDLIIRVFSIIIKFAWFWFPGFDLQIKILINNSPLKAIIPNNLLNFHNCLNH